MSTTNTDYDENKGSPTDINNTAQAFVTKGDDGKVLDNYAVQDKTGTVIDDNTYSNNPNTTTPTNKSNTGSGIDAALGTNYSWNTKAEERAGLDYEAAVLESKSNYLTNRQELEAQGQQMQNQVAMDPYSKNQSAEKAGWTGGYVLDTERQMAYLKQTIQSQMYGQMELQKYGYDTSLAAARLAYDTQKYDLALEYYNTALQRAVTEADITGYYVAPEVTEMLNEYSIASSILNAESGYSEEEKERADKVLASVYEWFEANGISKQGVITMNKYESERDWNQSLLDSFEYIDQTTNQITGDKFIQYGADGKPVYSEDGTKVQTINFKTMSSQEILDYIAINDICKEQFYGYIDNKITGEMSINFEDYCIANKMMTKNEDGTYSPKEGINYENEILRFLQSSSAFKSLKEKFGLTESSMDNKFQTLLENYDFEIALPDGSTISTTFNDLSTKLIGQKNALTNGSLKDLIRPKTDENGNVVNNPDGSKAYANNIDLEQRNVTIDGSTFETTYVKDANLYFTSLQINQDADASEDDVTLTSGLGDKFNLELAETLSSTQKLDIDTRDSLLELYQREFGKEMPDKTVIVYNDVMYVYRKQDVYSSASKEYETKQSFLQLKGQCNDDTSKPAEFIKHLEETWGSGK